MLCTFISILRIPKRNENNSITDTAMIYFSAKPISLVICYDIQQREMDIDVCGAYGRSLFIGIKFSYCSFTCHLSTITSPRNTISNAIYVWSIHIYPEVWPYAHNQPIFCMFSLIGLIFKSNVLSMNMSMQSTCNLLRGDPVNVQGSNNNITLSADIISHNGAKPSAGMVLTTKSHIFLT